MSQLCLDRLHSRENWIHIWFLLILSFWNRRIGSKSERTLAITFGLPPPAATDVVVDQLNKLRHKQSESMHLVLVPRLMTGRWRKMMTRGSDFYFKLDWTDCWDESEHHEPLLCFVFLPFLLSEPHLKRRRNLLADMERLLSKANLSQVGNATKWHILRQLLLRAWGLCPM